MRHLCTRQGTRSTPDAPLRADRPPLTRRPGPCTSTREPAGRQHRTARLAEIPQGLALIATLCSLLWSRRRQRRVLKKCPLAQLSWMQTGAQCWQLATTAPTQTRTPRRTPSCRPFSRQRVSWAIGVCRAQRSTARSSRVPCVSPAPSAQPQLAGMPHWNRVGPHNSRTCFGLAH